MSEVYIEPYANNPHHYENKNYSMDIESSLNNERDKVLFYATIIVFSILIFFQIVIFSYYIFKNCCENNPCKRISRKRGLAFELGELEHHLDKEESETAKRLENEN